VASPPSPSGDAGTDCRALATDYEQMKATNKAKTANRAKNRALALLLGGSFVVLFEAGWWLVGVGPDDALFVASGSSYRINPQAARRFFPRQYVRLAPGQDRFAGDKDAQAFRVFALGASTLLGFPNPAYTSFPNFLQQMLADAYPARAIEVVNCGVTAINSFVVRAFVAEVVEHEPDLVVIYAGHNEFVGPYGAATPFARLSGNWYFIQLQMFLQQTKTYYLLDSLLYALRPATPAESFGVHLVQREIYLEDEAHRQTEAHYQRNMAEIVEVLHEREVPVALCTLASNLSGFYPLRSAGPAPPPGAALADYPQHAALHFDAGLAHQAAGDSAQALAAFVRARDLDGIHLRACSPFNRIIRTLAAESGAILIDVEQVFATHAPAGLVGDALIAEYLHPTVWGHYLIAQTIMTSLFARENALDLAGGRADALDDFAGYCRRLGYGVRERVLACNDLILLLKNMPYAERPPILEQRLMHLVGEQLADLPKLSYAQIADFARRGGVAFLAAVIAELADPEPLADALDELMGPLGLMP